MAGARQAVCNIPLNAGPLSPTAPPPRRPTVPLSRPITLTNLIDKALLHRIGDQFGDKIGGPSLQEVWAPYRMGLLEG